uniref:polysaccharide biosynthesis/export family protein n=1 Tax=Ningiella ruwaisensis TaxID=2364274 RepID=UPI001F4F1417|nr:polysaccharide biosynthesis/export family protein [Ningiella ruwaisensis]
MINRLKLSKSLALLTLVFSFSFVFAQENLTEEQLQQARQASESQRIDVSQFIQTEGRNTGRQNNQLSMNQAQNYNSALNDSSEVKLYGESLFSGGNFSTRSDGLNSAYRVAPGDKISVQMWGTVNREEILTVDNAGNVFIKDVGPVQLEGAPANQVNQIVTSKIKSVFPNNVNMYVNLLTATPVNVYVSGPVNQPGQYAGFSADSLLFYLASAGGIDTTMGSFRDIEVLRAGEVIQQIDLYRFLTEGFLPSISFQDDDVILVGKQQSTVIVEGEARNPVMFELLSNELSGGRLMELSRPLNSASHVAVSGNRANGPITVYMPIEKFTDFELMDGDEVLFNDDTRPEVISVQLSGSYEGPSFYTVRKGTKLLELLNHIEIKPQEADFENVFLKRESVALQQKVLLEESLQRLERSVFTSPASSSGEASIRASEAELVSRFIERARRVEPLGKVVIAEDGKVANIRLEQGDEIVIPIRSELIQVSGEVLLPQALVYNAQAEVSDYVAWAGGFTERANDERIVIVKANGLTESINPQNGFYWIGSSQKTILEPGDQILVLPKTDEKIMQSVKDITQILYQLAITANVALDLTE